MAFLAAAAPYIAAGGSLLSADAQAKEGRRHATQGVIQQAYNEVAATQATASGQRRDLEERRQAQLAASRAIAVGAAGGSQDDIDNIIANIQGEGEYRASLSMYEAEAEADRLRFSGESAAKSGREKSKAGRNKSLATVLQGAGSLYSSLK